MFKSMDELCPYDAGNHRYPRDKIRLYMGMRKKYKGLIFYIPYLLANRAGISDRVVGEIYIDIPGRKFKLTIENKGRIYAYKKSHAKHFVTYKCKYGPGLGFQFEPGASYISEGEYKIESGIVFSWPEDLKNATT